MIYKFIMILNNVLLWINDIKIIIYKIKCIHLHNNYFIMIFYKIKKEAIIYSYQLN